MKNSTFGKLVSRARLRPWHLALCVLLVGWVPALVVAYLSHTVVSRTLEERINGDAQTLVDSLSKYVEDNVVRTGETMDYFRTLPATATILQNAAAGNGNVAPTETGAVAPSATPATTNAESSSRRNSRRRGGGGPLLTLPSGAHGNGNPAAPASSSQTPATPRAVPQTNAPLPGPQEWLSGIYYSQSRIDGMFLTDAEGRLLAAVPPAGEDVNGRDFASDQWRLGAMRPGESFYVSPVYTRPTDGRLVTSTVVAIHDRTDDRLLGFLGADTLVERMGRRLDTIDITRRRFAMPQLIDQNGFPLFTETLTPSALGRAAAPTPLRAATRRGASGSLQIGATLYTFSPVGKTGWSAVLEESAALTQGPVRNLRAQTYLLVGLIVAGSTLAAWLVSLLYRRQLNAALAVEREQIFSEKILATMATGIALIESNGDRLLQANASFFTIVRSLGTLPPALPVTSARFGSLGIADVAALHRVQRTGTMFQAVEQPVTAPEGQTIFLTTELLRLQDSQARTLGVLCLVEDRTAEVTMRQELIDANTAKDQFFAQLSHELRTPLSPVVTMVAELERLADGEAPADARRALEVIRRNVELEARLIDDLLDITRIRSGKLQLNRQVVCVHRVIELAVEITREELAAKQLRLDLQLEAKEHHTIADPARLQQVFWNLIKNSVKFTPAGRRIVIRTCNLPVENGTSSANGKPPPASRLHIEVSDEGIGIAPENLDRIFHAFDQGQSAITRRFGGLGLGLAICRAMVEAHGGRLSAESAGENQGATFRVELMSTAAELQEPERRLLPNGVAPDGAAPAYHSPSDAAARAASNRADLEMPRLDSNRPPRPLASTPRRVLLVDDHLDTCLGMKLLLRRRGYEVTIAHTVAEALATAEGGKFDLLISDLGLPDATGFDLMQKLRDRPNGSPPGIALSGFGMESDLAKSAAAGFSEHLIKPVNFERLDAAMRRLLAHASVVETS
ncbi:MAG: response regulator [Verrucomicrobia bacterium]|nr:response regulator [Verrucomicrobiota bacterium]